MAGSPSTALVVLKDGTVVAQGTPAEVITEQLVETVYEVRCQVVGDPQTGTPMVVPAGRHQRRR